MCFADKDLNLEQFQMGYSGCAFTLNTVTIFNSQQLINLLNMGMLGKYKLSAINNQQLPTEALCIQKETPFMAEEIEQIIAYLDESKISFNSQIANKKVARLFDAMESFTKELQSQKTMSYDDLKTIEDLTKAPTADVRKLLTEAFQEKRSFPHARRALIEAYKNYKNAQELIDSNENDNAAKCTV